MGASKEAVKCYRSIEKLLEVCNKVRNDIRVLKTESTIASDQADDLAEELEKKEKYIEKIIIQADQ